MTPPSRNTMTAAGRERVGVMEAEAATTAASAMATATMSRASQEHCSLPCSRSFTRSPSHAPLSLPTRSALTTRASSTSMTPPTRPRSRATRSSRSSACRCRCRSLRPCARPSCAPWCSSTAVSPPRTSAYLSSRCADLPLRDSFSSPFPSRNPVFSVIRRDISPNARITATSSETDLQMDSLSTCTYGNL